MDFIYEKSVFFKFENSEKENAFLLFYSLVLFVIPLIIQNQILAGTIVNAILIYSAALVKTKKVYLLSVLPSTSVFLGGVLFANLAGGILFMLPFIWASNIMIMAVTRKMNAFSDKKNFGKAVLVFAPLKTVFLLLSALGLFMLGAVPEIFILMFGWMQLTTVILGAATVFTVRFILTKQN